MAGITHEAVQVDGDQLQRYVTTVLVALGFDSADAEIGAKVMVGADLRGHRSHGVRMLPDYVPLMRGGAIRPHAKASIVRERPGAAVMDGGAGMGQVVAYQAAEHAIRKTRQDGAATTTVLVRNSNHFGAADYFSLMCAEAGLIGIVMTNSPPFMSAPGARGRLIGNSPFSYGIPAADGQHMVLDIALCESAGGRIVMAAERGERIPEGWLTDPVGRPTTDPNALLAGGALVPIGGHKGYGLALLVETLSGVLSGAAFLQGVVNWFGSPNDPTGTGHTIIAIDPEAFMPRAEFDERFARLRDEIHAAPKAEGAERIYLPGEIELEHEAKAREQGLEFDSVIWASLTAMASEFDSLAALEQALR